MDDLLSANPQAFKMLRAFSKLSFIKFGDEENQAFRDAILKHNEKFLKNPIVNKNIYVNNIQANHSVLRNKLNPTYALDVKPLLASCSDKTLLKHEMAIEAGLIYQLTNNHAPTIKVFGKWDYLSHQVIASPFKPLEYIDKIDVFGYRYIDNHKPTKSRYLVTEIKRSAALPEDIHQLMKNVDWVKDEYCYKNYGMIEAYLIASSFDAAVIKEKNDFAKRQYILGRRPAQNFEWKELKLIKYEYDSVSQMLLFSEIT